MIKSADFSEDRVYRYALWRRWDSENADYAMFIGLNPSTADETNDDATIRRCIRFAQDWGYSGLCMANLFAFRATQPKVMKKAADPIGKDNDQWLSDLALHAKIVVAAWGKDGIFMNRAEQVKKLVPDLHYLRLIKSGQPEHPLYLPKELKPIPLEKPL